MPTSEKLDGGCHTAEANSDLAGRTTARGSRRGPRLRTAGGRRGEEAKQGTTRGLQTPGTRQPATTWPDRVFVAPLTGEELGALDAGDEHHVSMLVLGLDDEADAAGSCLVGEAAGLHGGVAPLHGGGEVTPASMLMRR